MRMLPSATNLRRASLFNSRNLIMAAKVRIPTYSKHLRLISLLRSPATVARHIMRKRITDRVHSALRQRLASAWQRRIVGGPSTRPYSRWSRWLAQNDSLLSTTEGGGEAGRIAHAFVPVWRRAGHRMELFSIRHGVMPAPEARHNGSPGREAWESVEVEMERRRCGTNRRHIWDHIAHHVFPEA
jgi:hypothetical protein